MNPFGPEFSLNPETEKYFDFLVDLDRMPLRLDQCPTLLAPLFCDDILDLKFHMEKFRRLMLERGYGIAGQTSTSSALVVIRGAIGSGKTTLGAWMIGEMARLSGEPWECIYVPEPDSDTDTARIATLDELREQIRTVPKRKRVAALVENVSADSLQAAIARFNQLQSWPRLFVLTTHNIKLLDADERTLSGAARIELFTLRPISPADADAYVAHRLQQYRDPKPPRDEIKRLSPVFPFPLGLAGRYVQRADDGDAPVVLRQLNTNFRGKLAEHAFVLQSRKAFVPVENALEPELPGYLLPDV